jgi:FkbM family methyltransferase
MLLKRNKLIFTDSIKKNNIKFNYIDVGARGDISSPWKELEKDTLIVGFEPDIIEAKRLNNIFKSRKYYGIALWSKKTNRKVYINEWESTSSMYVANKNKISCFASKHWTGRKEKLIVDVDCDTLDEVLKKDKIIPDFIKIDTQGAELEILKGAEDLLKEYSPIVTCETWCYEVYKDAPMMHEVIAYMDSLGYQVFDMELAAAWRHTDNMKSGKQKTIGYEILFVKKYENINMAHEQQLIKLALLLELYGYRDYAYFLLKDMRSLVIQEIKNSLLVNDKKESKFLIKVIFKIIQRCFGFWYKIYPNIRY